LVLKIVPVRGFRLDSSFAETLAIILADHRRDHSHRLRATENHSAQAVPPPMVAVCNCALKSRWSIFSSLYSCWRKFSNLCREKIISPLLLYNLITSQNKNTNNYLFKLETQINNFKYKMKFPQNT